MLGEDRISKFVRYADHDLPELTSRVQLLANNILDLEFNDLQNTRIMIPSARMTSINLRN